jgi:Secreted and surface protein containing fasciclin-like repeats
MLSVLSNVFLTACYNSDDIGGNLYTFKDQNLGEYLKNKSQFSEFTRLLDTTGVMGLLNAYGAYTCFAPDNNAMLSYYKKHGKTKLSDFTSMDTLKMMAYDHLIKGDTVLSSTFVIGNRLASLSMSDRYFIITKSGNNSNDTVYINDAPIISKDTRTHNGVVYEIGKVIEPVRAGIVDVISKDSRYTLFYKALIATGLADSLLKIKDDTYDATPYLSNEGIVGHKKMYVPRYRKYGYTLFLESDATLASYGITDLASLTSKAAEIYDQVYPEDKNISNIQNRSNSLNRFIAYHILTRQLDVSKLIDAYDSEHMLKTVDMFEYVETMCPNTLIEVSKIRSLNITNQLNRIPETGDAVHIGSNYNIQASNGIYHEVDKLLAYNSDVDAMLSSKRLRFDAASFFDEFANNNLRGLGMTYHKTYNTGFYLPKGYMNKLSCSDQTSVNYLTCFESYLDYQGDEIWLTASSGKLYDFTITTPPVPAGTYEVRFGYQPTIYRGAAQVYFDGAPAGLPINFANLANSAAIGWKQPGSEKDDPYGYQNDKMLRNRGYMKGPASFTVPNIEWYTGPARISINYLRKILGTFTFDKAGSHKITIKGLSNGEFMIDFVEFVPTSAIEGEDVY